MTSPLAVVDYLENAVMSTLGVGREAAGRLASSLGREPLAPPKASARLLKPAEAPAHKSEAEEAMFFGTNSNERRRNHAEAEEQRQDRQVIARAQAHVCGSPR